MEEEKDRVNEKELGKDEEKRRKGTLEKIRKDEKKMEEEKDRVNEKNYRKMRKNGKRKGQGK